MDWLHNPVADLSGPAFLALYALFAAGVIAASRLQIAAADRSSSVPEVPVSVDRDPYAVAYLRGGGNELLRFTVFDLVRGGFLALVPDEVKKKTGYEKIAFGPQAADASSLDGWRQQVLAAFAEPKTSDDVFKEPLPTAAATLGSQEYAPALLADKLLTGAEERATATRVIAYGVAALLLLAAYRFATATVLGHKNVGILVVEVFISVFLLFVFTRVPRVSRRGRSYISRLQATLRPAGMTPALAAAGLLPIFVAASGMSALAGTEYGPMNDMFRRQASSSGCGGGSCGNSSSGGDGGGDGGGCGGGCGG